MFDILIEKTNIVYLMFQNQYLKSLNLKCSQFIKMKKFLFFLLTVKHVFRNMPVFK